MHYFGEGGRVTKVALNSTRLLLFGSQILGLGISRKLSVITGERSLPVTISMAFRRLGKKCTNGRQPRSEPFSFTGSYDFSPNSGLISSANTPAATSVSVCSYESLPGASFAFQAGSLGDVERTAILRLRSGTAAPICHWAHRDYP